MSERHVVDGVWWDATEGKRRLADSLRKTFNGKLQKQQATALACVMAMTLKGHVSGFWGDLFWEHEAGQFDSGEVTYNW